MQKKCDVLIIGCGIAGLVAGLELANKNLNLILIEKHKKIGVQNQTKIDITESIGIETIIKKLQLPIYDKSNKSKWFSPKNQFLFESKVSDLFIKRGPETDSFDSILGKRLLKGGKIPILFEAKLEKIKFKKKLVSEVIIRKKNKKIKIIPKFVIGADGSYGKTAKLAKLNEYSKKETEISGFGVAGKNLNIENAVTHIFFDNKFLPGGYFYVAQSKKGLGFAMAVFNKKRVGPKMKKYYHEFLSNNIIANKIMKNYQFNGYATGSCKTAMLKSRVRNNLCLVGDAARVMDPIFGYGARQAILSGFLAAKSIENSLKNNKKNIIDYEKTLFLELTNSEKEAHLVREVFDKLTNSDFDFLVESANFINSKKKLDEILENPPMHLSILLHAIIRKPHKSIPTLIKYVLKKIFYF